MIPPRSTSNSMSANLGTNSMTQSEISKQLRNKSPNQTNPFQTSLAGSRQFHHKYGQQENSQRQLGSSLRQNKSGNIPPSASSQRSRLSTDQFSKKEKGSRTGSQKNQPSQRQITPLSKGRDQTRYKETGSIESLGSRSTESDLSGSGFENKMMKTMHEPYSSKFGESREDREEKKQRPSSLSGSAAGSAFQTESETHNRLQIKIPGGSLA